MITVKANTIPYLVIVILVLYIFSLENTETEITIKPVKNEKKIKNPVPIQKLDTTYKMLNKKEVVKIIKVKNPVNDELLTAYEIATKENDSLKQLQLYKEAVTERTYKEVLEDSIQTITVKSDVVGTLKNQFISYETKLKVIKVKKIKTSLYVGAFTYTQLNLDEAKIPIGVKLGYFKKNKIYSIGYDTNKRVQFGVAFKLF